MVYIGNLCRQGHNGNMLGICAARGIMGYRHVTPPGSGYYENRPCRGRMFKGFLPPEAKWNNQSFLPPEAKWNNQSFLPPGAKRIDKTFLPPGAIIVNRHVTPPGSGYLKIDPEGVACLLGGNIFFVSKKHTLFVIL